MATKTLSQCPKCHYQAEVPEQALGRTARCPRCKEHFVLLGAEPPPIPTIALAQERRCPRCERSIARLPTDELGDYACPACDGSFMERDGVERLVAEHLRMAPEQLRGLQTFVPRRPLKCPGCGEGMSSLTLRGIALDYCAPCTALWFDPGELHQLSGGKYGTPPPEPILPRILPKEWPLPSRYRTLGWFTRIDSIWTGNKTLHASNPLLIQLLTLGAYRRRSTIDGRRREIRTVTWLFWFFPRRKKIKFKDVVELVPTCESGFQRRTRTELLSTESALLRYEVSVKTRDGRPHHLASFCGTVVTPRFEHGVLTELVNRFSPNQSYYSYYDRASFLLGMG